MKTTNKTSSLTRSQLNAILYANSLGKELVKQHPEIVEDSRNGMSQIEIGIKLLGKTISSSRVCRGAVKNALEILLDKEERKSLCKNHRSQAGKKISKKYYPLTLAIYKKTKQERIEHARKGGEACYKKGVGVHALTTEELYTIGKRVYEQKLGIHALGIDKVAAGKQSAILRREIPWTKTEEDYLCKLVLRLSWQDITDELNKKFENNRSKIACQHKYYKISKTKYK